MNQIPLLVVSDCKGNIFEVPEYRMAGMSLNRFKLPVSGDLIELPEGSDLFRLPDRVPIGYDPRTKDFVPLETYKGKKVFAVGAFMSPAYLQVLTSACRTLPGAPRLPLYCYTAAGWMNGKFYVPAMRIDEDIRQDYRNFDLCKINKLAKALPSKFPGNRLVKHLVENCVLRYGCPAARNFIMGRWECPIPTSRTCNAFCLGCISKQDKDSGFVASHERITFTPTVEEIVGFTVPHLQKAPRPVVSFGQGCEGEPLLEGELLVAAVKEIRKRTSRGIINLNTNGSLPDVVEKLCEAGLDSIRVSMNSAREKFYNAYYRPRGYCFDDVKESVRILRRYGRWASINYLVFPGFTDTREEIQNLSALIKDSNLSMIQTRNLNIDPDYYREKAGLSDWDHGEVIGIPEWVNYLRTNHAGVRLGYFNPPYNVMKSSV
ncbi:MAG: radical SAM protein [Fibrobacter sp.]|nr:radical SAM protein [Fibrobacter sp.]